MIEKLEKRFRELIELEKQAWANLNCILGAKAEVEEMIKKEGELTDTSQTPTGKDD